MGGLLSPMRYAQVIYLTAPAAGPVVTRAAGSLPPRASGPGSWSASCPPPRSERSWRGERVVLAEAGHQLVADPQGGQDHRLAAAGADGAHGLAADPDHDRRVPVGVAAGLAARELYRLAAWSLPVTAALAGRRRRSAAPGWGDALAAGPGLGARWPPPAAHRGGPDIRAAGPGRPPGRAGAWPRWSGHGGTTPSPPAWAASPPPPPSPSTGASGNGRSVPPGA